MGLIRFLLAVCVVVSHTGSFLALQWMSGANAVVVFFIISGFYMSLILNEKYIGEKSNYWLFISNRLLRLMPLYYTVIILHIILCGIGWVVNNNALALQIYIDNTHNIPVLGWLIFIFCNVFIVGMDTLYYLHLLPAQGLAWTINEGIPTAWFMLMVPAWTLSIELLFYFIAPFILRKHKRILSLTLIILAAMIACYHAGIDIGDETKSLFATSLIYFLIGGVAWLIYNKIKSGGVGLNTCKLIFGFYLVCLFLFPYLYPESKLQMNIFYFLTFISLPFVFQLTKNLKWDAAIGEYSYPIYITHEMVNDLLKLFGMDRADHAGLNLLITIALSYLLIRWVSNPVERLRQVRVQKQNGPASPAMGDKSSVLTPKT